MNKIFRTKSATGGFAGRLDRITKLSYTIEGDLYNVVLTMCGGEAASASNEWVDATLTGPELEALLKSWDAAL